MSNDNDKFEAWGLLEILGHQRIAGQLSEQNVGGCHFVRVDVPAQEGVPEYTKLFTQASIFSMTLTTEDVARKLSTNLRARPISAYDLAAPQPRIGLERDCDFFDDPDA